MEIKSVVSSNISGIGYDEKTQLLAVVFSDGNTYHFFDVPSHIAAGLMDPPGGSYGKYFHSNIKGQFRYSKL